MALNNDPPTGCTASDLSLPTFSGPLNVPGSGSASTTGLPIELKDDGDQSPQCENQTLDFTYTGSAQYTDSTSTSLASSSPGNTSTSGSSVTFTATTTETSAGSDSTGPTGTVTFYSCTTNTCGSTTSLGTGTVGSNGQAMFSTSTLPVGSNYIEAVYGGSGTNLTGSTSNVVTQTVTSGSLSTTSSLTSSPNPSTYGHLGDLQRHGLGLFGYAGRHGDVLHRARPRTCGTKTSLGTGTLSAGKATYATSSLPVGTTYVEAVYRASGNDLGSTSNVVTQVVNALSTTSSLTSSPNPSSYGSSVSFTDTVSASSGTPGGSVTFYSCTTTTCRPRPRSGPGPSSGKATYATSSLPVGTTYVEAVYSASGNDLGSTSNVVAQVVNALSTTSSLTSSPNPSSYGSSVSFTDTVSASSGTPGGSVTFYSCTTTTCGTKTSLGTGTLSLGQGHLRHLEPPGGHHLRRGRLLGLGQLLGFDLQRRGPGGQRPLDHLESSPRRPTPRATAPR